MVPQEQINILLLGVLISFREWLHSYIDTGRYPVTVVTTVLISFREWLHSYQNELETKYGIRVRVLISFREWLHSYYQWHPAKH